MAKPVEIMISHELGREKALERIRGGFDRVGNAIGMGVKLNQRWEGEVLHFDARALAQKVNGTIEVFEKHVRIEVTLPAFLAGMAEMIGGKIKKESTLLLEKK